MATYEQAISALKAADKAGNTEDAKRLASIAAKLKPAETEKPSIGGFVEEQAETFKNDVTRVGENLTNLPTPKRAVNVSSEGLAEGIGGIFGLPVDAVTSVLNSTFNLGITDEPVVKGNPVGGSQHITESVREIFRKFGVEPTQAELGNFTENLLRARS